MKLLNAFLFLRHSMRCIAIASHKAKQCRIFCGPIYPDQVLTPWLTILAGEWNPCNSGYRYE